jgi:hypothetical protein
LSGVSDRGAKAPAATLTSPTGGRVAAHRRRADNSD